MGPDIIWGKPGLFQQVIFALVALSIWAIVTFMISLNPASHEALIEWQYRVSGLFHFNNIVTYLGLAILIAAGLSLLFLILETLIAMLKNEDITIRLQRNDFLLPVTPGQKWRALGIIFTGSLVEEILFRAYLFQALFPLWNHWIWAALIVSAIFALVHTNMQGLSASIWIFLTSMLLITILMQTSSLLYAVILHFSINFFNLFIIPKGLRKIV